MTFPSAGRYPLISAYAIVGDSRACALISTDGSVDWMCLPNFDSPSVFARLLDWDRGGYFQICPTSRYSVRRRYIPETNVLETTFETSTGTVSLTDFMPAQRERVKRSTLAPLRTLVRFVECSSGRVPMRLEYAPRPNYGRGSVKLKAHSSTEVTASGGRHTMHLRSDVPLDATQLDARANFESVPGRRLRFSLAYSYAEPAVILSDQYVDELYEQTLNFWREWSSQITHDGHHRDHVVRSALALKLLAYAPSGAIAAAATTSLPEQIGGERNYDYRFCWIRDASLIVKSFLTIGLEAEANAFVGWLMHATHETAPRLAPLYTLYGEQRTRESEFSHFDGYRGSRPVRIGNLAAGQHQFDVYGELIEAIHRFIDDQGTTVSADEATFISRMADFVARNWRAPDHGIWEARIEPLQYTHSKVMAWAALYHAGMLVEEGAIRGDAARWRLEAEELRELVLAHAYNQRLGAFTQTLDGDTLDSAVLMMPLVGFIDAADPRMQSTIDVLCDQLVTDGFIARYSGFDDGLPPGEGAFIACNFWLAGALAAAGRTEDANHVFGRTTEAMNDLGLMAEEYDSRSGEMLGNFPQGFSHLTLINAAIAIDDAERKKTTRRWSTPK